MPLNDYERHTVVALHCHLESPSASKILEIMRCKGVSMTR